MKKIFSDIRNQVIHDGVAVEFNMAHYLAQCLNIDVDRNKPHLLPLQYIDFMSKAKILKEMKSISSEQFVFVQKFCEIRNVFAHNMAINTFSEFFDLNPGHEKKLRELFPFSIYTELEREDQLNHLYTALAFQVENIDLF